MSSARSTSSKKSLEEKKATLLQRQHHSNQYGLNTRRTASIVQTNQKLRNTYSYHTSLRGQHNKPQQHQRRHSSSSADRRSKSYASQQSERRGSAPNFRQYEYRASSTMKRSPSRVKAHGKPPIDSKLEKRIQDPAPSSAWVRPSSAYRTHAAEPAERKKTGNVTHGKMPEQSAADTASPSQSPSQTLDARSQKLKRPSVSSQLNSSVSSIGSDSTSRSRTAHDQRVSDYYLWCGKPSTFRGQGSARARRRPSSAKAGSHHKLAPEKNQVNGTKSGKSRFMNHHDTRSHIQQLSSKNESLRRELHRMQLGRSNRFNSAMQLQGAGSQDNRRGSTQLMKGSKAMYWGGKGQEASATNEGIKESEFQPSLQRPKTAPAKGNTTNDAKNGASNQIPAFVKKPSVEILDLDTIASATSSEKEANNTVVVAESISPQFKSDNSSEAKEATEEKTEIEEKLIPGTNVAGSGVMALRNKLKGQQKSTKVTREIECKDADSDEGCLENKPTITPPKLEHVKPVSRTNMKLGQFFKNLQTAQRNSVEKATLPVAEQTQKEADEASKPGVKSQNEEPSGTKTSNTTKSTDAKTNARPSTAPGRALGEVHHEISWARSGASSAFEPSKHAQRPRTSSSTRGASSTATRSHHHHRTPSKSQESERERLRAIVSKRDWNGLGQPDMYVFGKLLGQGSFGTVRLAHQKITGHKVAVKTYEKAKMKDPGQFKRCRQEIVLMQKLNHPNVICLFETFETSKRIHLVMEAATGGNLCSYVKKHKRLTEKESVRILHQLVSGVEYLHSNRMVHRDIKLENVLFDSNRNMKLVDYGFSVVADDSPLKVFCGTPSYMAPEIVKRKAYMGFPVDIWSLGVLLYAMLCGCFPFTAKSYPELYKKILRGVFHIPDKISTYMRDLLRRMLCLDAQKRFTIKQVRQHPILQQANHTTSFRPEDCFHLIAKKPEAHLDFSLIKQLTNFGFNHEALVSSITTRRKNHLTASYYLLGMKTAKKRIKQQQQMRATSADIAENVSHWNSNRPATAGVHGQSRKYSGINPSYTVTGTSKASSALKIPKSIDC